MRCAWRILAVAYSLAISTNETRTKVLAPMLAVGNTKWKKALRMKWATSYRKIDPAQQIEVKNVAPTLGEGAVTDKVFLYTESQKPD